MDLSNEADQTLVIIGNGMVSHRLCQRMVEYNAVDDKRIVVFSDEPRPAYDRVHLTDLLSGTPSTNLTLATQEWYAHNGIELFLDDPVVEIDRANGIVRSQSGHSIAYTRLVFATGAKPFVPSVEVVSPNGEALPGVFVYRSVDDVYDIEERADELLGTPFQEAAVIGGGILGLEAAKAVYDLGLDVHVIEVAPGLMPRQLDADGAAVLRDKVKSLGVNVHCGRTLKEVEALPFDMPGASPLTGLRLTFDKGDPLMVGLLIFAAGVRPRGELAEAAGLSTSEVGGIIVDDRLHAIDKATGKPDEHIHAIGDCVSHRGASYGLILPGYQMVDVLASNLVGGHQTFDTPDTSVRLKLMGVSVAALGEYDGDKRLGTNVHVFNGGGLYRKLIVRNGKLIGAVTIGDWDNLERIRELLRSPLPLSFWDMRRFRGTGDLWAKSESPPVAEWPPEAVVCGCFRVTRGAIGEVLADGCTNLEDVCGRTKAGTLCGSCKPLISELLGGDTNNALQGNDVAPVSQRNGEAPVSRREGIRSRREASRSRTDLMTISNRESGVGTQRAGTSTGRFEGLRSTLVSSSTIPPPLAELDDEPAPASVRPRAQRQTEAPKVESVVPPRVEATTASNFAAVMRSSTPAADVKPSPRSLAVLAALHGDFSSSFEEPAARKEDTKVRKDEAKQRKDEPIARRDTAPTTPRTGMAIPDVRRDEPPNSAKDLERALPFLVSGAAPLPPDAAISTLTPAAGMVLGPALRAYAAREARVADMDAIPVKPPRTHTPTPVAGVDLVAKSFGNKAVERTTKSTPPTGMPVVSSPSKTAKSAETAPASSVPPTPPTGTVVPDSRATSRTTARPPASAYGRESSSGTPTSSVTVEANSQPPRSRRAAPSVKVVTAEPLSTRTPASGMVFDKAQLGTDAYAQLAIPRSARTGFEATSGDAGPSKPATTRTTDRRTPISGLSDTTAPPPSVRSRALQNRNSVATQAKRLSDPGGGALSSDRSPTSVRRPSLSVTDEASGTSEFPTEQSRSRQRISLISTVDEAEIAQVLGRESLIPDRGPPVSRRTWVPPKNLSSAPGTLTTTSSPPPRAVLPSSLPPERGRKALLFASIFAVSWTLVLVFAPAIPPARSVHGSRIIRALTRDDVWQQISGYALVAVCLLSLGISLRKRWKRFQFADVPFFRGVHGVVAAASLVLFFAHTGFRVGHGMNFIVGVAFLVAMLVGAGAGVVYALSDRWSALAARDRRLRVSWVHILVLWPLPILIALHVIMVYYY